MSVVSDSPISDLNGRFAGERCFIVGCGPSLDEVDLSQVARAGMIFALNAAITLLPAKLVRAPWWVFRDVRVTHECAKRLPLFEKIHVATTHKGFIRLKDVLARNQFKRLHGHTFVAEAMTHRRTVAEDALQLVRDLGFAECYLVGVDHAVRDGQVYANGLEWKDCYFTEKKPGGEQGVRPLEAFVKAMEELRLELGALKVFNCSPIYPREVFARAELTQVLSGATAVAQ